MKIAMVGLGKMGANMTERLLEGRPRGRRLRPVAAARDAVAAKGAEPAASLEEVAAKLDSPRVGLGDGARRASRPTTPSPPWAASSSAGDVVIDGGNSNYKEAAPTAAAARRKGHRLRRRRHLGRRVGPDRGLLPHGGRHQGGGGGRRAGLAHASPPTDGYAHVGPVGAGHFVKMVHNGIEYGLMQAYAEGFEIMNAATEFDLDLHEIASIWRYGSVVRSWLLELTERALRPGAGFEEIEGVVVDSGEGRWTVDEAIDRGVPAPVITAALFTPLRLARATTRSPDSCWPRCATSSAATP